MRIVHSKKTKVALLNGDVIFGLIRFLQAEIDYSFSLTLKRRMKIRDECKMGIPMGPTGFPWERKLESELDRNGNDSTGIEGNGYRTVRVKR
jgi:hypothetical protein